MEQSKGAWIRGGKLWESEEEAFRRQLVEGKDGFSEFAQKVGQLRPIFWSQVPGSCPTSHPTFDDSETIGPSHKKLKRDLNFRLDLPGTDHLRGKKVPNVPKEMPKAPTIVDRIA